MILLKATTRSPATPSCRSTTRTACHGALRTIHAAAVRTHEPEGGDGQRRRIHVNLIPGLFRPVVIKDTDYMIDRQAQKHYKSYSGVKGTLAQDAAIQSTGPIQDRSKENLVSTDNGVIMAAATFDLAGGAPSPTARNRTASIRQLHAAFSPRSCCWKARVFIAAGDALWRQHGAVAHASV